MHKIWRAFISNISCPQPVVWLGCCMFCEINADSVWEEVLFRHHTFLRDFKMELQCDTIYIYERPWVSIVENSKIAEMTWFKPFFEISYFHIVLSLKMNGAVSPLLHTHSQSSQIQLYLTLCVLKLVSVIDIKCGKWQGNFFSRGPDSWVCISTAYGLDGPGSNPGGGKIFRTCPDRPWGPPSLLYNGYQVFPGVRCSRGVTLTPHPLLVPRSKIE